MGVEQANWNTLAELKNDYGSDDYVGNDRHAFNIKGNNCRLVALIHFSKRTVYVSGIFTHAEYDRITDISTL